MWHPSKWPWRAVLLLSAAWLGGYTFWLVHALQAAVTWLAEACRTNKLACHLTVTPSWDQYALLIAPPIVLVAVRAIVGRRPPNRAA